MSYVICVGCDALINSDDDPECFIHDHSGALTSKILCEPCRDNLEDDDV